MPVSLSNSKDIVANSISVIKGNKIIDVLETVDSVKGLAPDTLDSLEKLATALNNNPTYYTSVSNALDGKASTNYVNTELAKKANATDVATGLASKATPADITTAINNLINEAPVTMNTLKEISNALNDDNHIATTLANQIATKAPSNNPTLTGTVTIPSGSDLVVHGVNVFDRITSSINATAATLTYLTVTGIVGGAGFSTMLDKKQNQLFLTDPLMWNLDPDNPDVMGIILNPSYKANLDNAIAAVATLTTNYVAKQTIGNITYFYSDTNTSNGFRMAFNKYTESVDFQYFDNDSITPTDGWQSLGTFTYNTTSNVPTFSCNNITATSSLTVAGQNIISALSAKQDTLTAGASASQAILISNKIKGLTAGTNMSMSSTADAITINGPDLSGKQNLLTAGVVAGQDALATSTNKIKGLTAGTNMSLSSTADAITINGPDLANFATLANPSFTGTNSTPSLKATNISSADAVAHNIQINDPVVMAGNVAFNGASNTASGNLTVNGALTVGTQNIVTALSNKQGTLSFTSASDVRSLGNGSTAKGIKAGSNVTISDVANVLTVALYPASLSGDYFTKQTVGSNTYLKISSAFRLVFNSETNVVDFQYFDNDGAIATDAWVSMGFFAYDTAANTPTFQCNQMMATNSATANEIRAYNASQVTLNDNSTVNGDLIVGNRNIITALDSKQIQLLNGTIFSNTARVLVPDGSGKIRSVHGDS